MESYGTVKKNKPTIWGRIKQIPRIDKTLTKAGQAADAEAVGKALLEWAYPIGAVYMSTLPTNPGEYFGGKWERIKDRFLLASGDRWAAGTEDGEASVILNSDQIPHHSHELMYTVTGGNTGFESDMIRAYKTGETTGEIRSMYITGGGADQAHNNMPPYLAIYMWKRIA